MRPRSLSLSEPCPLIRERALFLCKPNVHLRYFAEGWMDRLLAFVRHFYMPQLPYWRYEELPGADSFSHIDPSDHEGREQAWAEVKQNLAEETAEWVPKGRELVALFEHARRSGGVLRRQVFAVAYEGPIDFDTLCDRVLAGVDQY